MKTLIQLPARTFNYIRNHGFKKTLRKIYIELFCQGKAPLLLAKDSYFAEIQNSSQRSPLFRNDSVNHFFENPPKTKLICFYLPQFHPFEENNSFWGKGFTEWTNVTKAMPQFKGHYQPRYPTDLGCYDLRLKETIQEQTTLANKYGIYGFCIHYYWFSGKKVMDTPIELIFNNKDIPLRYSICWANENWTRRWDGNDGEILLQQHDHEDDYLNFIKDVSKYFADDRYIKIDGKPLLVIYRAELLKNVEKAVNTWRSYTKQLGYPDVYLVLTESFGLRNPLEFGFDAAMDFAPNNYLAKDLTEDQLYYSPTFKGKVYDYESLIGTSIAKNKKRFFHTLCLAWDNTARKTNSVTFHNYSPLLFGKWLAQLILKQPLHDIIFVNAWNEWAEGTYLEPDRKYGHAALHQVAEKLSMDLSALSQSVQPTRKYILVAHDAHLHGAQMLALHMAKTLKLCFKSDVMIVLLDSGELHNEFLSWGNVYLAKDLTEDLITSSYNQGFRTVIINSAASLPIIEKFASHPFKIVNLVHEMPQVIRERHLAPLLQLSHKMSEHVVYPNMTVKSVNETEFSLDAKTSTILSQGVYCQPRFTASKIQSIFKTKNTVLSIGYGDHRKGLDLFVKTAYLALQNAPDLEFVWVGKTDQNILNSVSNEYAQCLGKNLEIRPPDRHLSPYYENALAFLLASREDPNPSVALEALSHALPLISWEKSGGAAELIQTHHVGVTTRNLDPQEFLQAAQTIQKNADRFKNALKNYKQKTELSMGQYMQMVLNLAGHDFKKVSVVVPSSIDAHHLEKKLQAIVDQTYPVWEIVVDSGSTSQSDSIIRNFADKNSLIKWIYTSSPQGDNTLATGEFVWNVNPDEVLDVNSLKKTLMTSVSTKELQ